jgi:hypothetical protein
MMGEKRGLTFNLSLSMSLFSEDKSKITGLVNTRINR